MPSASGYAEELRLQAEIARQHATASTPTDTDWPTIAEHYHQLEHLTGSPIVRLNRAVAVAEVEGPEVGLTLLADLGSDLDDNHRFHAIRADLLARSGRTNAAIEALGVAMNRCENQVEMKFLDERRSRLANP